MVRSVNAPLDATDVVDFRMGSKTVTKRLAFAFEFASNDEDDDEEESSGMQEVRLAAGNAATNWQTDHRNAYVGARGGEGSKERVPFSTKTDTGGGLASEMVCHASLKMATY